MKNNCLFCLYNHFIFTSSGSISLNSIPLPVHEIAPVFVGSSSRVTFYNNVDCKKIQSAQCSPLIKWSKRWPGTARAGGTHAGLGLREKNWNLGEPFCPAYTFFPVYIFHPAYISRQVFTWENSRSRLASRSTWSPTGCLRWKDQDSFQALGASTWLADCPALLCFLRFVYY